MILTGIEQASGNAVMRSGEQTAQQSVRLVMGPYQDAAQGFFRDCRAKAEQRAHIIKGLIGTLREYERRRIQQEEQFRHSLAQVQAEYRMLHDKLREEASSKVQMNNAFQEVLENAEKERKAISLQMEALVGERDKYRELATRTYQDFNVVHAQGVYP